MTAPGANLKGAALGLAAMAAYATHDAAIKLLGAGLSPFQLIFFVALLSMPVVAAVALARGGGSLRPRHPGWVALRTCAGTVNVLGAVLAFSTLPLAQVYAILFAMPLLITLMAVPLLSERVGPHRWAAIAVGLVGVLIVLRPGQAPLSAGHLGALVAAAGGSLAAVIARRLAGREATQVLVVWPILLNLAVTAVALPWVYRPMGAGELGLAGLIALFGMAGAALSVLAYRAGQAAVVAPMQYSQILWAVLYGWLLFDETPDRPTAVGLAVIVASGLYILWRESRGASSTRPVLESDRAGDALPSPRPSPIARLLRR
ncbi:DMT family transporter [Paracoccus luteus]|uniref:DMT family transporter n=1 Tax=Paracoccus luteus TaxID=2508543 RepID=UPI00106F2AC4|nr:DMT family transporter [Paracoccus luteus]